jgi:hypothetical protein
MIFAKNIQVSLEMNKKISSPRKNYQKKILHLCLGHLRMSQKRKFRKPRLRRPALKMVFTNPQLMIEEVDALQMDGKSDEKTPSVVDGVTRSCSVCDGIVLVGRKNSVTNKS